MMLIHEPGQPFTVGGNLVQDLLHVFGQQFDGIMAECQPVPGH